MDISQGEKVEGEISAFIARRDAQRRKRKAEGAPSDSEEEAWKASARRRAEEERREILWERLRFAERMILAHTATHETIVARHRAVVERCEKLLGINETKGAA